MKKIQIFSLICLLFGILFFILGFIYGDINSGIFIIFPFVCGSGIYSLIAFLFVFIAIFILIFGSLINFQKKNNDNFYKEPEPAKKTSLKASGLVLIGPIPIIIGSNRKIAVLLMVLAIIVILISFFYFY